jgi:hypothetical protein
LPKKKTSPMRLFTIRSSKKLRTKKAYGACVVEETSLIMNGLLKKKPFYFEGNIEGLSCFLNKAFNGENWHLQIH